MSFLTGPCSRGLNSETIGAISARVGAAPIRPGRFQKGGWGNPSGRPRGSRNAASLAAEALLDGQAERPGIHASRRRCPCSIRGPTGHAEGGMVQIVQVSGMEVPNVIDLAAARARRGEARKSDVD